MVRSIKSVVRSVVPEFSGAELGDPRRTRRLLSIVRRIEQNPAATFPRAVGSTSELEALYRFTTNMKFSAEEVYGARGAGRGAQEGGAGGGRPRCGSAARHSFLDKKGGSIVAGGGDLLDDVRQGRVKLADVKRDELPAELASVAPEQRAHVISTREKERDAIKVQLDRLVKERAVYVRAEEQKRRAAGAKDGFDAEVMKAVKTQAAARAKVSY